MSQVRAYLRSMLSTPADLGETLGRLNDAMTPDLRNGLFVTLVVTVIDVESGHVEYASAGHTPCYVLAPDGSTRHDLRFTGIPLGLDPGATYGSRDGVTLEEGDVLLLLTDGVTEARGPDGSYLLDEGALGLIRPHLEESAAAIVEHLHQGVREFSLTGSQDDDITMVVLKRVKA